MSADHRPRKRFGQHFLHDPGVIERIVRAIMPQPGQHLVEIGPGLGALTLPLLRTVSGMDVVELDRDVVPLLEERCRDAGSLRVHVADALRFQFCDLASEGGALRVVGNLPYNISTPLVFHLLEQIRCIDDMHFMLQKEVVTRMAAGPGGRDYGRLSVMVQYYCRVTPLFDIGKGAFRPAPKVDSSIVRLRPHPVPPVQLEDPRLLGEMVARAFAQRRKTLRNGLKGLLGQEQIEAAGVDPGARAETLCLKQFAALSNQLSAALRGTHSEES
jgi:16S rRNA (adenine1518-N6/adenine1519-N6)-dimethyltransferase